MVGLSFGLRFWGLGRFNRLVFDETHFVRFAQGYLQGEPVFDVHPPLGKYLIAVGLWLAQRLPTAAPHEDLGIASAPIAYRWMTALLGTLIPLLVMGIAHELGQRLPSPARSRFALLAGLFVAIDGLFVVESRYALINIHLIFFGLLGHWLWLRAARLNGKVKGRYRILAGIALGACVAVKWNGAAFALGLVLVRGWGEIRSGKWLIYLGIVPIGVYGLLWIPHLLISHDNLWDLHRQIWQFHQRMGQGEAVHAYCSSWYTWPLLLRPVAYDYQQVGQQVYDVHGLGNPPLWWLSTAAVLAVALGLLAETGQRAVGGFTKTRQKVGSRSLSIPKTPSQPGRSSVPRYLIVNYAVNWLPWLLIQRCTFLYHYMPAAVFAFLTFAWLLSRWLHQRSAETRTISLALITVVLLAALFWLPIYLGLPLSPDALRTRWWLKTWI